MKRKDISHDKLNALVHVHVFQGDFARNCGGTPDDDGFCSWCRQIITSERPHAITVNIPNYASDIRDAWRIVEHYTDVQLHWMKPGTNRYGGTCMAAIDKQHRGLAPTMSEALCLAALAAAGIEVEL